MIIGKQSRFVKGKIGAEKSYSPYLSVTFLRFLLEIYPLSTRKEKWIKSYYLGGG